MNRHALADLGKRLPGARRVRAHGHIEAPNLPGENAAEARETRSNSVTAREWELALPAELDAAERRVLVMGFARELVSRYGVAADVAIHAPHRDGDQRNHHAHVLTTTRAIGAEGFGDKTRVLDAKATGGPEIEAMRARWAELQNAALERQGHEVRVDHRSLAAQREAALAEGHEIDEEERALMSRALDENSVIIAQMQPFFKGEGASDEGETLH